jgi:RNA polymerase sigma-70 factor (ECF subfamily)
MGRDQEFEDLRPLLFSIAYRILGSVAEAEDAVQETWLRFATSSVEPRSLKSVLSTMITRISIDVLRSARVRREQYVGPWMPEPLAEDPYEDPQRAAELADSVSMSALLLLERLTPLERAVFVLRDVFAFDYAEVAAAVGRSEAACRQLLVRARRHMQKGGPRFEADRQERLALADRFFDALKHGDVDRLREMLTADVVMIGDGAGGPGTGGGVIGAEMGGRILAAVARRLTELGVVMDRCELNGRPGALLRGRDGTIYSAWILDVAEGLLQAIHSVQAPEKLRHLGSVGDLSELIQTQVETRSPILPPLVGG